jgi:Domain of unknown function (DUF4350)
LKKFLPYVVAGLVLLLLLWLVFSTQRNKYVFNERISFNKRDKIPYGMYVAYHSLSHIFPNASVIVNKKKPSLWDSVSMLEDKQALIIISPRFMPDEAELHHLWDFVKAGNTVFISSHELSYDAQNFFNCDDYTSDFSLFGMEAMADTLSVGLLSPPFPDQKKYDYPGRQYDGYFGKYNKNISYELGNKNDTDINFIQLKAGRGSIYLHLAPLTFSNYFLLHGQNINYYNKMLSLIPKDTKKVVWDEYFLYKRISVGNSGSKGPLSALMSQRSFRAALLLLILLLTLYILQEMRRKQRIIPVMAKPRNDSLEFVKTIGRLYHEKRDNKNLGKKMAAYFLEHVRNRYKLSTNRLDDEFIISLQGKTAQPENNIREIISFINNIDEADEIADGQLADFHKKLEEFYKTG